MTPRTRVLAVVGAVIVLGLVVVIAVRSSSNDAGSTAAPSTSSGLTGSTTSMPDGTIGTTASPTSSVPPLPSVAPASSAPPPSDGSGDPAATTTAPAPTTPVTQVLPGVPATTLPIPLAVAVTPTAGPGGVAAVAVNVQAQGGSQLYGYEARLCRAGVEYGNEADFDPMQEGKCVAAPLSSGTDDYQEVAAAPPFTSAQSVFKVGTGTSSFTTDRGTPASVTCSGGGTCVVVLKLQFSDRFAFRAFPVG